MMRNATKPFWGLLFLCSLLFTGCRDKEFDEHYGRPDWLPSPIYQQLQEKGNFNSFISCIDKAGYKRTLSSAGYFTVFAPNDAAFDAFLTSHDLLDVDAIDSVMAREIVTYALVYNAFEKQRLSDFQSNQGWVPLSAFKRRTAYYTGVYTDVDPESGDSVKTVASNRNGSYVFGDNNNKYIPYFISDYMSSKNLTATDYTYLFPNSTYSGFNVADASVVAADIRAENGVIHEIDKVILPLPSLDEYLTTQEQYSRFKELLETYTVTFNEHNEATSRYKALTKSDEKVYVKLYSSALGFSPNNENFMKVMDNDGQSDGWTMFIPENAALDAYINTVLLEHHEVLDSVPPSVINDFLNAHFWQTTVWPSKFSNTLNTLGEEARFDPHVDIVDRKVLSNGFLYGATKVQHADVFRSVYGRAYLDPKYSLMSLFLSRELRSTIISPHVKFTLFLVSDEALESAGYGYNVPTNEWVFNGSTNQAVERWTRLIEQCVLFGDMTSLVEAGITETYGGEFIKFENNTVFAAGNLDLGQVATVTASKETHNGTVHYIDDLIRFPERGVGFYIGDQGNAEGDPYKRFYDYLRNSTIFNATTGDILGVSAGSFHTFFIPTNTAIDAAITAGLLPSTHTPTAPADKDKVVNFILYHMLPKFSIIHNGKEEGTFESLYKTLEGDATTLTVSNVPGGTFTVTDMKGNTAQILPGPASHVLGNRTIIHQIDRYLEY